jgi:hypothetical protein
VLMVVHIMTVLYIVFESDELKETDMGRSCNAHVHEKCIGRFGQKT